MCSITRFLLNQKNNCTAIELYKKTCYNKISRYKSDGVRLLLPCVSVAFLYKSERVVAVQKKFYISRIPAGGGAAVPVMDRFSRVEKLNSMLSVGWVIKGFNDSAEGSYFLLEKV